ncbi:two-component sensor histidine kinase, partial [Streptomyces lydicus]
MTVTVSTPPSPSSSSSPSSAPVAAPPQPTRPPRPPDHRPAPWLRPTIRIRLALLYGGMFLMAGVVLLVIIYFLAARTLKEGTPEFRVFGSNVRLGNISCPDLPPVGTLDEINSAIGRCLRNQREQALHTFLNSSVLALLGLTVVAFAFGYAMAGRVLSPLGRITRT